MKRILPLLVIAISCFSFTQGDQSPVKLTSSFEQKGDTLILTLNYSVEENWMVYDSVSGEGPIPITVEFERIQNAQLIQTIKPTLKKKYDDTFMVDIWYFDHDVTYKYVFITSGKPSLNGFAEFMSCNLVTGVCLRPTTEDISYQ